jgi:glycosyltransferase involved in cell wall biosynthesis
MNFYLAAKHYCLLLQKLLFGRADLVYIPISQTAIGFLRDVPFVILSKLFKKKVILHLRGGYFREFYNSSGRIMRYVVEKTLAKIDRMIVLGECLKVLFDGLIPAEKLSVVPNGTNMSFDSSAGTNHHNDDFVVLFLSNLIETKGFKEVLFSAKDVINQYQNVRYVFAGDWRKQEDKTECERYIQKEQIGDHVDFVGGVTGRQQVKLLQEADVFVMPTYYPMEGHPWVIVEAMAAGLPIIATDHGCIRESVIDNENGFIIPKRDHKAIVEKLSVLIEHPEQRRKMGRKSRQFYEDNFTKEHFAKRMIDAVELTLNHQ